MCYPQSLVFNVLATMIHPSQPPPVPSRTIPPWSQRMSWQRFTDNTTDNALLENKKNVMFNICLTSVLHLFNICLTYVWRPFNTCIVSNMDIWHCFTRICMCIWIWHVYIVSCICQMNVHIRCTCYRRKDSSQMHVYIAYYMFTMLYVIYYIRFKISTNTAVSGRCFNALSWVAAAQLPEHQRSGLDKKLMQRTFACLYRVA